MRRLLVVTGLLVLVCAVPATAQLPCGVTSPCPPPPPPQCSDGADNDRDGAIDLRDAGCTAASDTTENSDVAPDPGGNATVDVDPRATGKRFGINPSLGMWSHWPTGGSGVTPEQEVDLISRMGGNAQRYGVSWRWVERTRGQFSLGDLAPHDRQYNALVARGMLPIIIVWDAPTWASDYGTCTPTQPDYTTCLAETGREEDRRPPKDMTAYARFVRFIADRYPLAAIETWNEPDIRGFWNGTTWPQPDRMAQMQCVAYDAVKAAGRNQLVLSPGFATAENTSANAAAYLEFVRTMYQRMGSRVCWDVNSFHVYTGTQFDGPGGYAARALRLVRNLAAHHDDGAQLWITETGASTSGGQGGDHGHTQRTEAEQKTIVRGAVNEFLSTPDIRAVLIHTLRDRSTSGAADPAGVEYGFGLLRAGAGPTPPPKTVWCHLVGVVGGTYPGC